jgi:biotin synthase-related radical SAM superfamily protein
MILRPMILVRAGFLNPYEIRPIACFAHFYMANYMLRSGQIENSVFIFDLEN